MSRRSDAPTTFLRVTSNGYVPAEPYDAEIHARYRIGTVLDAKLDEPKSPKQLRLFWWALSKVVPNQDRFSNARGISNALLMELGYVESMSLLGGGMHFFPQSIAEMEHPVFNAFFDQAMGLISEEVIPGLEIEPLLKKGRVQVGRWS